MGMKMAFDSGQKESSLKRSQARHRPGVIKKLCVSVALLLCFSMGPTGLFTAPAQTAPSEPFQEYQVKAAFLYNFAHFVEWPNGSFAEKESPFVLGIIGEDPFEEAMGALDGKAIGDRELVVRKFNDLKSLERCHMLFVSASEKSRLAQILDSAASRHVLTVSDINGFCEAGGHITFLIEKKQIRFQINPASAQRSGLKLSAQLLKLARICKQT